MEKECDCKQGAASDVGEEGRGVLVILGVLRMWKAKAENSQKAKKPAQRKQKRTGEENDGPP